MSKIRGIVIGHIVKYNNAKIGKWDKKESPPPQTFELSEIYSIGEHIISELEGEIADKIFDT